MEIDPDISRWILDFLLRQPRLDDRSVKLALSVLPLPDSDLRLKKSVLLRSIQSEIDAASVSEKTLDALEVIEEVDSMAGAGGLPVSDAMREAYRSVAVECTVRFLHGRVDEQGEYFRAVERLWRGRVRRMGESEFKSGLLSPELLRWRLRIEAAMHDGGERENLLAMNTRGDAFRSIRAYLSEAWERMGPSFLDVAASWIAKADPGKELVVTNCRTEARAGERSDLPNDRASADPNSERPTVRIEDDGTIPETSKRDEGLIKTKQLARHRRSKVGVKIIDNNGETGGDDAARSGFDTLPSPDVNRVQEELKSSSLELRAAVTDPLPDAIRLADSLVHNAAGSSTNFECAEAQIREDVNASGASADQNVGPVPGSEENHVNLSTGHQNNQSRPSLFERNSSAHTYEWDDSIDGSPEGPLGNLDGVHLPSPRRGAVSPLRKPLSRSMKVSGRRKVKRWSLEEEETLRNGVQRLGKGNWKLILHCYRHIFEERTEVDLKDKWRNMNRY
ncbi:hypothetical protein BT93_H0713 [Corymbia citriodora subsp. variegata]|nr:hypothetical protein BT93_H0713 [Corymbia citriodora subsp. variegata]